MRRNKCRSNFLTGQVRFGFYGDSCKHQKRASYWTVCAVKAWRLQRLRAIDQTKPFQCWHRQKKLYGLFCTVHCNRIATVLCKKFVRSKIGPDPTDTCIQKGTDGQTWSRLKRITIWPNSFSKDVFAICSCNRIGEHIRLTRSCDCVILTEFLFFAYYFEFYGEQW